LRSLGHRMGDIDAGDEGGDGGGSDGL
jgi:hypothetical protein